MFKNLEALGSKQHRNLKYKPVNGYLFAKDLHVAPLAGIEVAEAAKFFPIVFPVRDEKKEGTMTPMALLSLEKGRNAFVDAKGNWLAGYIPAHIRRYPFVMGTVEDSDKFAVIIDKDAPQFQEEDGSPLFDENGEATDIVSKAKEFLATYQADITRTLKLTSQLEEKELLVSKQYNLSRGEEKHAIRGFQVVDPQKLSELDDATLAAWVRNGFMSIIMAHMHSLGNIQQVARLGQLQAKQENDG